MSAAPLPYGWAIEGESRIWFDEDDANAEAKHVGSLVFPIFRAAPADFDGDGSVEAMAQKATSSQCACFPGMCRGGQVIDGKLADGRTCRDAQK